MPRAHPGLSQAETNCRKVPCPVDACKAPAGEPCRGKNGTPADIVHFPRREAAVAAGVHTL